MKNLTGPSEYRSLRNDQEDEDNLNSPQNPFASETNSVASYDNHSSSSGSGSSGSPTGVVPPVVPPHGNSSAGGAAGSTAQRSLNYSRTRPNVLPETTNPVQGLNVKRATATAAGGTTAATGGLLGASAGSWAGYDSGVPSSRHSSGSLSAMGSAEFDRYPHRISSAAPSVASGAPLLLGQQANNQNAGHHQPSSSLSDRSGSSITSAEYEGSVSGDPFASHADFSPFGGYPVSSFPLHIDEKEADDYLHNPDPILDAKYDRKCQRLDKRGLGSVLACIALIIGAVLLFIVYPVLTYSGVEVSGPAKPTEIEILTRYKYDMLSSIRTDLVDSDTPSDAQTRTARDGSSWNLVFSDEFNKEGRTFYDGDDQFWQGVNIHYASTQDLEWYDPDAASTANGTLNLRLDAFKNHNLYYRSAMVQSWNKLCFTQGILEVSAQLPGSGGVPGLWPGIWTLGNLGRPGYLATTDGTWPYSYSSCDAGITPNQSSSDGISWLPGQRLASCVCSGHDHPNPGTGRGAPEIDAIEGAVGQTPLNGVASQSLQMAPFDIWWLPNYDFLMIHNKSVTAMNTYTGGPYQQAISGTTTLNHDWYQRGKQEFQSYGFEYLSDDTKGYIRWFVGHEPTFDLLAPALGPNGNVGQRQIPREPMSIVLNLGLANSWAYIDWNSIKWPNIMRIDYVRIYQPSNAVSLTCDPDDYPTYDYIQDHLNAYENNNLTSWAQAGYAVPPNSLTGTC